MGLFSRSPRVASGMRLSNAALFQELGRRELRTVLAFLHFRNYLDGEIVFDAGEEGQALYLIVSGTVAIWLPGREDAPLVELTANSFFGELGLLDDWPRSAQARAKGATEVAVLYRGDFEQLMTSHAGIASKISLQLARHLAHRLRQMLQRAGETVQ